MIDASPRTNARARVVPIVLAAVVAAILGVLIGVRWNAHVTHLRLAQRESTQTGSRALAYGRDLDAMHATGKAYTAKLKAMFAATDDSQTSVIGQMGVMKDYADQLLRDTSFDTVMSKLNADISGPDETFLAGVEGMKKQEGMMHDVLTALSTTIGVVLNNPLMALTFGKEQGYAIGNKLATAGRGLGESWTKLENHVSDLRHAARVKHDAADTEFRETRSRNVFAAILNP